MNKESIEKLEKVVEALYQKVDGSCPWCHAKDYPVCGDKQGYDEVKAEDAEEWHIEHDEDCIVTYLDQALALLTEQPPAGDCFPLTCKDMYEVIQGCCGLCPWCVGVLGRYVKQESTRLDRSEASRKELLTACGELVKFCYPDGKWRGWNNMKGILEIMQPIRRLAEKK